MEDQAELIQAARDELIRLKPQQGEVLHNDDTGMRVLRMAREPSDDRTRCVYQKRHRLHTTRTDAGSPLYFTVVASTPAKICAMCFNTAPRISRPASADV